MVVDQGYEVSCAEESWKIDAKLYGEIQLYFELFPSSSVSVGAGADQYIGDMANAKIGMLRGSEAPSATLKISSLEGFFGAFNIFNNDANNLPALNSTDVANRLMSAESQCYAKYSNLAMMDKVCQTLNDQSTCAFNFLIEGVDPETKALDYFRQLTSYFSDSKSSCKELMAGEELSAKGEDLRKIMNSLPLSLAQAYRLAFLVIAPQQNVDEGSGDPFSFLQNQRMLNQTPKHPPIFLAFRIPEFLTNKPQSLSGLYDGGKITESVLRDRESLDKLEESQQAKRSSLANQIIGNRKNNAVIDCQDFEQCKETGDDKSALRRALVDIINGSGERCTAAVPRELAGKISTPAAPESDEEKVDPKHEFKPQYVTPLLSTSGSEAFAWNLVVNSPTPDSNSNTLVSAYIVAPLGTNIESLNSALTAFFGQETIKTMEDVNVLPDYYNKTGMAPENFAIQGANIRFKSTKPTVKFIDPACKDVEVPCNLADPSGPKCINTVCNNKKSWTAALVENKVIGLVGARVGWLVRKIQETLRANNSRAYEYIKSCERVEDLFLGKCAGVDSGDQAGNTDGSADVVNGVPSSQIDCAVMKFEYDPAIASSMKVNDLLKEMGGVYNNSILIKHPELVQHVIDRSKVAGWNPALVLALGREETAWGGVGNRHILGCMVGNLDGKTDAQVVDQQLDCLFDNFKSDMGCENFMCKYSGDSMTAPCVIKLNPNFAKNLPKFYRLVTGQ